MSICVIFPKVTKSWIVKFPYYYLYEHLQYEGNHPQNLDTPQMLCTHFILPYMESSFTWRSANFLFWLNTIHLSSSNGNVCFMKFHLAVTNQLVLYILYRICVNAFPVCPPSLPTVLCTWAAWIGSCLWTPAGISQGGIMTGERGEGRGELGGSLPQVLCYLSGSLTLREKIPFKLN